MRNQATGPILVVEDDEATGQFLALALAEDGWRTALATDGEQAIRMALRARPGLVILDICLPTMASGDVANALRRLTGPRLPIIAVSASNRRHRAALLGACAYIPKPFELDALLTTVRRVVRLQELSRRSARLRDHSQQALARLADVRDGGRAVHRLGYDSRDEEQLCAGRALRRAVACSGAGGGGIVLARPGYKLELVAAERLPTDVSDVWRDFPADAPVPVADAAAGEEIWLPTLEQGVSRYPTLLSAFCTTPAASMCSVPIPMNRTSLGALTLFFGVPQSFEPEQRAAVVRASADTGRVLSEL